MDFKKKFGDKVRLLRTEKGYSQESFATFCKLHRTYMGLIERGKANVSLENIVLIANKLDITVSELLKGI
ncbi:helix-turn-helix domain-containing protein [Candidatus Gracilibacteria bacterium]|nr:helix-turn-helix domain-containing protein [Candidatus Gracilibacteria bacterium]